VAGAAVSIGGVGGDAVLRPAPIEHPPSMCSVSAAYSFDAVRVRRDFSIARSAGGERVVEYTLFDWLPAGAMHTTAGVLNFVHAGDT
jgi:hypothetical protein